MYIFRVRSKGRPGPVKFKAAWGWRRPSRKVGKKIVKTKKARGRHARHLMEQHLEWKRLQEKA